MGRAIGFIGLIIALAIGMYIYSKQAKSASPEGGGSPKVTIDLNGVKQDLINIAKAERGRMATDGKYLPLDELISGGDLHMSANNRGGYTYSVEINGTVYKVIATYGGTIEGYPKTLWCDDSMEVHQE